VTAGGNLLLPELGSSTLTFTLHLRMYVSHVFMLFLLAVAAALLCEVVPWLCAPLSASFSARR